ncbi:hypothetical protein E6P09_13540 [Haloferax mediterranei ATCC 33500]|uniref:CopG family transcriptional regulator n=1 Tax=Haloferax mediterranei (strain ATCC 33500 / DSM 1411 / JCM 8866 / NBRC 14739 / NCIMB 2177 / R-4) TaxID=523841 RepID=I3R7W5_HALMT|nr:hypothetical protein [Haloferax mediterranei]AFK20325.1 hypothetical protein HFX_2647 [Haloferax mediterranei ATCC 33500]AHZ23694.1 hypothetical protein BM92_14050 [Haloferax mediterranei ATCC 33500]ELZ99181.1 hypothetical protein C439_15019 [Haloferax mediterranei ATCC 33500]MDX5986919.1 hypothetical protein [Haloferax mediterranei ATCC 33500]QCQ76241.1 hypothetical protein E6P09_13540 [Haloferax mediterranei ATCC 33500]
MEGDDEGELPDGLREWVDERADEEGVDPETVLTRAVGIYRLAVTDAGESLDDTASVPSRIDTVEGRVGDLEDDLDEKISDVRMRVVQVKRETDEKASQGHEHLELEARLDRATDDIEAIRDRVTELDNRLGAGFENFEEILTYLDEATESLDENLRTVAQVLLDLRSRATDIEAAELERKALSDLLRVANDANEHKAKCGGCGETVHLNLLTEPRCPACRVPFRELSPSSGFFGSATLHTGRPPALEAAGTVDEDGEEVAELLDEAATGATNSEVDRPKPSDESPQQEAAASGDHGDD